MKITADGKKFEFDSPVRLSELAEKIYGKDNGILIAKVNGKLKEIFKSVKEDAEIKFFDILNSDGRSVYERGLLFVFIKSVHDIYNEEEVEAVRCEHSVRNGVFCEIDGKAIIDDEFVKRVKERMNELIRLNLPFKKKQMPTEEAVEKFRESRLKDKEDLFKYRRVSVTNVYSLEDYYDYFYGYMPQSTGILKAFDIKVYNSGIMLILPENGKGFDEGKPEWKPSELLFSTMKEANSWGQKLGINNVGDFNDTVSAGKTESLILVNEALQEKKIAAIAEMIASNPEKRAVMISGPSSSGKTTFSHRLSVQLMVNGLKPHPIAADDYFKNRDETPRDENGDYDFEALEAIDVEQFNKDMTALLKGEQVNMPTYNFKTGKREYKGKSLKLSKNDIIIVEGIHGLNDKFSYALPAESKFKIYISALTQLNIDEHNRIHTTDLRLIRRMVRDAATRGNTAEDTLARWASVRRGEEKNIFTFQEEADAMFDSSLIYELAVLKQYAEPLLFGIKKASPYYGEANRLLKFLSYFLGVPGDDVPKNSLVREFIGGSCFNI